MLNATSNQLLIFLFLALGGLVSGILFDLSNLISFLCNKNKIVKYVTDFFATVISFLIYVTINIHFNYGQHRLWTILSFFGLEIIERFTLGKILAKCFPWCYDNYIKLITKLSKLFKRRKKDEQN